MLTHQGRCWFPQQLGAEPACLLDMKRREDRERVLATPSPAHGMTAGHLVGDPPGHGCVSLHRL